MSIKIVGEAYQLALKAEENLSRNNLIRKGKLDARNQKFVSVRGQKNGLKKELSPKEIRDDNNTIKSTLDY